MRVLSIPDASDLLLRGSGIAVVEAPTLRLEMTTWDKGRTRMEVPADFSRAISLAYVIAMSDIPTDDELDFAGGSLWLRDWNIWGEGSDRVGCTLLDAVRRTCEVPKPVAEAPIMLLAANELALAHSLLTLSFIFQWDAYYLAGSRRFVAFCSHDGYVDILSADPAVGARLLDRFTRGGWSPEIAGD
jgi:hypothetical protein